MKQEFQVMITKQKGIILKSDNKGEMVYIRIVDEGKDIEFAANKEAFIKEMKKFCQFDELKHLYK